MFQFLHYGIGGVQLGIVAAAAEEVDDNLAIGFDLDAINLDAGRPRGLDAAGYLTLAKLARSARHGAPHSIYTLRPGRRFFTLPPVRSAISSSVYASPRAVWNCLSRWDRFTIKRRGAVGSRAIRIQATTRSGSLPRAHPWMLGTPGKP